MIKRLLISLALIAGIIGFGFSPASAQIYVRIGPPPPRHERMGRPPGPGYVWRGGYWRWWGGRYVWVNGGWIIGVGGCRNWIPGHWVQGYRGWYWVNGRWGC